MDQDGRILQLDASSSSSPRRPSTRSSTTLPKVALFVPKRMITMIVADAAVADVVAAHHQGEPTGQPGDGKIFVCAGRGCRTRIRTGEVGVEAVA